jgi:hypothetical protein
MIAHFLPIHLQTWPPQAIFVSNWPGFFKSSPLKPLGEMTETWQEASMEGPLYRFLISSRSIVNKHGRHRKETLVSDWVIIKKNFLCNRLTK